MSKALYRLYRPCKIEDVIGQPQVTEPLAEIIKASAFSHAYLFCGPRGCGKTSVARIFAHAINGFNYELEDEYIDIIEIDAASNTGVDNIRELRDKAAIVPSEGKYKVYIIDEVHMLSKAAFNALLKTLEEPPEHVVFIMATTDPEKIPPTILSRTQTFHFKLVDPAVMQAHLRRIADQEKIAIDDEALAIIVRRGGGSFRDSLSLLDQISTLSTEATITAEKVNSVLGLPSAAIIDGLLAAYSAGDLPAASAHLRSFYDIGGKPEALASDLIARIIENPDPAHLGLLAKLPDVKEPFAEARLLLCFAGLTPATAVARGAIYSFEGPKTRPSSPAGFGAKVPQHAVEGAFETKASFQATKAARKDGPAEEWATETVVRGAFDYNAFLAALKSISPGLFNMLGKCTHSCNGTDLSIFAKGVVKKTLEKPENLKVLRDAAGVNIIISAENPSKDPTISQISDIMGRVQEVNDGGGNPF